MSKRNQSWLIHPSRIFSELFLALTMCTHYLLNGPRHIKFKFKFDDEMIKIILSCEMWEYTVTYKQDQAWAQTLIQCGT